jgi:predicted ATP-grasp superfamily ATP-dependent carboligase
MRTIFVYEYCTALGLGREASGPDHSLWREGNAMRSACVADFERMPGVTVTTMTGVRPTAEYDAFALLARASDATLVVAPETDRLLDQRLHRAVEAGAKCILNSSESATNIAGDKQYLPEFWQRAGVPTPVVNTFDGEPLDFPFVVKHRFGAGSVAVRRIDTATQWNALQAAGTLDGVRVGNLLVQPYVPGVAVSASFLVGPNCVVPLLPGVQHLSDDGRFTYHGGEIPMPDGPTVRAVELARRAIDAVPGLAGYVGVDLILGDAADGSGDFAIEINPRLTTSYVGLRAMTDDNLMAKLWDVCAGASDVRVRWNDGRVRFTPDGTVTRLA